MKQYYVLTKDGEMVLTRYRGSSLLSKINDGKPIKLFSTLGDAKKALNYVRLNNLPGYPSWREPNFYENVKKWRKRMKENYFIIKEIDISLWK